MPIETSPLQIDIALLGMVFALILFIIVFSAIVLYLAFRIKETFREEKRRGILVAKIAFLIGVLFLAGGGFYFLTQALAIPPPSNGGGNGGNPQLTFTVSYPSEVRISAVFTMSFTVINPTESVAHGAVIQTNVLLQKFAVLSSTHEVIGNVVNIGDVPGGTVIVSLELRAPDRPDSVTDTVTLVFAEGDVPQTQDISIMVTGAP